MITHFWYRFGRTNSLEDVKVFLMSLWVLIRKDEERMSYAENYFFFNSISKRKIRLGEIICKAEKSKVKKFILSSFSWKCDKSMVFNECWCYYLPRGLRWLWKQPFILAGNPASVPSRFFLFFFQPKRSDNYYFFLIQTLSRKASGSIFLHPGVSSSLWNWFDPSSPADFSF